MRLSTLILSMLAHGGAIGAFAVVSTYARETEHRTPQVDILTTVASAPSAEDAAAPADRLPTVRPEPSELLTWLPPDPVQRPELPPEVAEPVEAPVRRQMRVSLARIRPVEEPPEVEPEEPPDVEPVTAPPQPQSVHVAASPRADNRPPAYPEHERLLGREGTVLVTAFVDRYGLVTEARLAEKSRYPGFNRAALAAVRQWRFTPGMRDGEPVADEVDVPVVFRLTDPELR